MIPEIRIVNIVDGTWKDKILLTITYYSQYDSPHMCTMRHFVTPEIRSQLHVGMVFNTYKEFEDFLNSTDQKQ